MLGILPNKMLKPFCIWLVRCSHTFTFLRYVLQKRKSTNQFSAKCWFINKVGEVVFFPPQRKAFSAFVRSLKRYMHEVWDVTNKRVKALLILSLYHLVEIIFINGFENHSYGSRMELASAKLPCYQVWILAYHFVVRLASSDPYRKESGSQIILPHFDIVL